MTNCPWKGRCHVVAAIFGVWTASLPFTNVFATSFEVPAASSHPPPFGATHHWFRRFWLKVTTIGRVDIKFGAPATIWHPKHRLMSDKCQKLISTKLLTQTRSRRAPHHASDSYRATSHEQIPVDGRTPRVRTLLLLLLKTIHVDCFRTKTSAHFFPRHQNETSGQTNHLL